MPRIRFDPENEVPPDFESEDYADVRAAFPVPANVVVALLTGWTSQHDKRKIAWALQVDEDRLAEEEAERQQREAVDAAQKEAADAEERARAEEAKKKPQAPVFDASLPPTGPHTFTAVALRAQQAP
ncbi:hypothetical protein A0H81_14832 [Grifola frondosa]|uniref:Uncharacterized protein n=1 Tax=Grifola frondosa TaxID=5627 RepID=A0A1C7LKA9_GRIFR|nr:hypothetical protein A0H81_14832 [Grifola frondosa]